MLEWRLITTNSARNINETINYRKENKTKEIINKYYLNSVKHNISYIDIGLQSIYYWAERINITTINWSY